MGEPCARHCSSRGNFVPYWPRRVLTLPVGQVDEFSAAAGAVAAAAQATFEMDKEMQRIDVRLAWRACCCYNIVS